METIGSQTAPVPDTAQETVYRLRRKLKEEQEKCVRQNENYKKKLELIRGCLKPELFDLERLLA